MSASSSRLFTFTHLTFDSLGPPRGEAHRKDVLDPKPSNEKRLISNVEMYQSNKMTGLAGAEQKVLDRRERGEGGRRGGGGEGNREEGMKGERDMLRVLLYYSRPRVE